MLDGPRRRWKKLNFVNFMSFVQESSEGVHRGRPHIPSPVKASHYPLINEKKEGGGGGRPCCGWWDSFPYQVGSRGKTTGPGRGWAASPGRGNEFFLLRLDLNISYVCACLLATGISSYSKEFSGLLYLLWDRGSNEIPLCEVFNYIIMCTLIRVNVFVKTPWWEQLITQGIAS